MRRKLRHGGSWTLGRGDRGRRRSQEESVGAGEQQTRGRGEAGGPEPSFNRGVCTPGPGLGLPPHHHTCLSRSLWVTPRGSVAKWGGAKLPGSSVNLRGGWGGPEACSGPSHPPAGGPRWPALQPDLSAPAQQLPCRPCSPPGEGLSSSLSGVGAW